MDDNKDMEVDYAESDEAPEPHFPDSILMALRARTGVTSHIKLFISLIQDYAWRIHL